MRFDLDNLLGLLFFVVFIILPLFSRAKKKGQAQQGQGQGQGTTRPPTAPVAPGQPAGSTVRRSVPLPGQPTASADRGPSTTITLEEIRRRVQEAQLRESGGAGTAFPPPAPPAVPAPQRGLVSSDPFGGSLMGGSSSQPRTILGREGGAQPPPRPTILGREGSSPQTSPGVPSPLGREGESPAQVARRQSLRGREAPRPQTVPTVTRQGGRTARAAAAEIGAQDSQRRGAGLLGANLSPAGALRFDKTAIMHGLIWHEVLGEPPSIKRLRRTRSRLH